MTITRPTREQLRELAVDMGMHLSDDDIEAYAGLVDGAMRAYDVVDRMPDYLPEVKYPRTPGYRPEGEENKYGAWYVKTSIKGRKGGKLAGKRIVLKDTVCVAGVPMMAGASIIEGYVADVDATIVTRMLDAGGEIAGKAATEYFSYSGSSHTAPTGPVENPYKKGFSAGGSSSGCGALVAAGEVDMAIGCDQAGSLRIPAALCGLHGMKQTYGLVPYTGIVSQDYNVDHAGPMTATAENNALLLEVLAGEDGIDPRQRAAKVVKYTAALGQSIKGLKIAVVAEGFGYPDSEPDVDEKVRASVKRFADLGAEVDHVSIPIHQHAWDIWLAFGREGLFRNILLGGGFGNNHGGLYVTSLIDALAGWRRRSDEFPHNVKYGMLLGHYVARYYPGHYYAKAINLARKARKLYDAVLADHDLLLMPTAPMKANALPAANAPASDMGKAAHVHSRNTPLFDLTHHPAYTLPCGMSDGLPIGTMLIAKHYDEATIYRAAHAFEQSGDWREM